MKKIVLLLVLVSAFALNAQIEWAEEAVIRQGENIEWYRSSAVMDNGNVVYVWSDTRYGDRDIFAQKMDSNGNKLWGESGIQINGEINRQEDPVIIQSGDGFVIAWVDFRNEDAGDVYAQKIDLDGNLLWDSEGIPLSLTEDTQISLNIVSDESGGAYVIWIDQHLVTAPDIFGTHIDGDGNISAGWAENGNEIIVTGGTQNSHTFWEDGTGGAVVVWHDMRDANNEDLYMQRMDVNGNLLWAENGTRLTDAEGIQERGKISPDENGGFIVTWRDRRIDEDGDIYAQKINLDGETEWATETIVYAGEGIQENPRIKTADNGGAFVVWQDGRNEIIIDKKDIYVQKIASDGSLLWNENGVEVAVALNDQVNPRLTKDDNGGCWIIWEDCRIEDSPYGDVYAQHFNANGEFQLDDNGREICGVSGLQSSPIIKKSGDNVFLVWGDERTGSIGMYLQVLTENGNELLAEDGEIIFYGLSGDALDHKILTNGEQQLIFWQDTRNVATGKQIYMQILNSDGSVDFVEDGEPITIASGYDQEFYDVCKSENEVEFCWQENHDGINQIYAQAVDFENNFLWSEVGMFVCPSEDFSEQNQPHISVYDNNGTTEYYIGWLNDSLEMGVLPCIQAQKIVDGNLAWGEGGKMIVDSIVELKDVVENYFIWESVDLNNEDIFCKRVDENGDTMAGWADEGTIVCDSTGSQLDPQGYIVPEGILIVWEDFRNGSDADIYGQILSPDGVALWAEGGVPLVSVINDQIVSNVVLNDDNNFFLTWSDFRNGIVEDIYMQKYDDGTPVWAEGGLEVLVDPVNNQTVPYLTTNGTEFIVFWEDYYFEDVDDLTAQSDLYAQKIDANGNKLWAETGLVICDAIRNQIKPLAVTNEDDAYVIWQDMRSSGKTDISNVYAQKLSFPVSADDNSEIEISSYKLNNYPNPFNNSTTISFTLNTENIENTEIEIYNLKGQLVEKISNLQFTDSPNQQIVWNAEKFASGIYFYKLAIDGKSVQTQKMILLK
ncbi:MAG: T9SS type A sorting domain-containing protein [Candidatus Cloacimonetes bacterium]|nr:T9SS type A sorting domain-containing protein [Candidatus Cloacimonadota bacterium]